ncbi:uncharacterized protein LOC110811490 [Carica papaya]|uniref:uncharacterized protein LOC110811490 n=1 Tax=Carica papaya TaxID=3649 RepID=UPI000B8C7D6F|nr:uncharacterized protein LOC110811490 [Carica papaya]
MRINEEERNAEKKKESLVEGLPMESSPYLKYSDLEDYKHNGYGTSGHLPVKLDQIGGATDAPTPAGGALSEGEAACVITAASLHVTKK